MTQNDNTRINRCSRAFAFVLCLMVLLSTMIPVAYAAEIMSMEEALTEAGYPFEIDKIKNHNVGIDWKSVVIIKVNDTKYTVYYYDQPIDSTRNGTIWYNGTTPVLRLYFVDDARANCKWYNCTSSGLALSGNGASKQTAINLPSTESIMYAPGVVYDGETQIYSAFVEPLFMQLMNVVKAFVLSIISTLSIVAAWVWAEPLALIPCLLSLLALGISVYVYFAKTKR